jgi:type II secretory pathway component GspD/PulD (secretin)
VIGGLVDQQVDRVHQGIPFLKDIPLLGLLFGTKRDRIGSSELFLFLTPYIVSTDEDADVFRERIETQQELIAPFLPTEPLTPPVPRPGLPALPDTLVTPPPPDTVPGPPAGSSL